MSGRAEGVAWEPDLEAARQRARRERKPLFVDFFDPG